MPVTRGEIVVSKVGRKAQNGGIGKTQTAEETTSSPIKWCRGGDNQDTLSNRQQHGAQHHGLCRERATLGPCQESHSQPAAILVGPKPLDLS